MLIGELRELIKKYKEEELRYIISEMYKSIPKKIKEEKNIDFIISDLETYKQKGVSKKKDIIVFSQLKKDIEEFEFLALNSLYFSPNKIVHKNERSKWRFKVKAFIKDLETFKVTSDEGKEVARLFEILFHVLSEACGVYLFPSEDPFRAIGISQPAFLEKIFIRKYAYGISDKIIKSGIELVINSEVDRETLPSFLINVFVKHMKTTDAKTIAVEQCMIVKKEIINEKQKDKKKKSLDYKRKEKINRLTELVFRLDVELREYENGIAYFKDNTIELNNEVVLYILLRLLFVYDLKDLWVKEYELAVKKGIKPRDTLLNTYQHVKEHSSLPDTFYL